MLNRLFMFLAVLIAVGYFATSSVHAYYDYDPDATSEEETEPEPTEEEKAEAEAEEERKKKAAERKAEQERIYSILNPTEETEATKKARLDEFYNKRNDQVREGSDKTTFRTERGGGKEAWAYMDWEKKKNIKKLEKGGVDPLVVAAINLTVDLAIKAISKEIAVYDEKVAGQFEDVAKDIKNNTSGVARMVRLENADEARKKWTEAMLINPDEVKINTIGQQLVHSIKLVGIKMVKREIGGDEGRLVAKYLQDAAF